MLPVECPQTGANRQMEREQSEVVPWGTEGRQHCASGVTATVCLGPLKKHLDKKEEIMMSHVHSVLGQIRPGARNLAESSDASPLCSPLPSMGPGLR